MIAVETAVLNLAEMYLSFSSDAVKARALAEEGLALAKELGDKPSEGSALYLQSYIAFHQGNTALARSLIEESNLLLRLRILHCGQRNIHRQYVARIESRIDLEQFPEAPQQQPCANQQ